MGLPLAQFSSNVNRIGLQAAAHVDADVARFAKDFCRLNSRAVRSILRPDRAAGKRRALRS